MELATTASGGTAALESDGRTVRFVIGGKLAGRVRLEELPRVLLESIENQRRLWRENMILRRRTRLLRDQPAGATSSSP